MAMGIALCKATRSRRLHRMRLRLGRAVALGAALVAAGANLHAQSASRATRDGEPCYLLALGPSVGGAAPRVSIPAVLALRPGGHVAGALRMGDTLISRGDLPVGRWAAPTTD